MHAEVESARLVTDSADMIRGMSPRRSAEAYVYCPLGPGGLSEAVLGGAFALFREAEGISVLLPLAIAEGLGLTPSGPVMARITLMVHSALDGVGLSAAVSGALAGRDIPCNVVAALWHDHIFVPLERADEAMDCLLALQNS